MFEHYSTVAAREGTEGVREENVALFQNLTVEALQMYCRVCFEDAWPQFLCTLITDLLPFCPGGSEAVRACKFCRCIWEPEHGASHCLFRCSRIVQCWADSFIRSGPRGSGSIACRWPAWAAYIVKMEADPCAFVTGEELQVRFAYVDQLLRRYRELEPEWDFSYYKYRAQAPREFTVEDVRALYMQGVRVRFH